jgi:DNA-binding transcriptional MerR regulator
MSTALVDILASIPAVGVDLAELTHLANQMFEAQDLVVDDGRANNRVDARTIRFYQTLGIVPKPEYEGRRAIYQREHLLRVISAKQLQSEGFTLAQIQESLPMRSSDDLARALLTLARDANDIKHDVARAEVVFHSKIVAQRIPHRAASSHATLSALVAYELAPGVTVLIDPTRITNHAELVSTLASAITAEHSTQRFNDQININGEKQ